MAVRLSVLGVMLAGLLALHPMEARAQVCGDNIRNQVSEQCDGTDDAVCPGQCTPSCLCAVCGDNAVNQGGEQCDGTDDGACPGLCQPSCLCAICGDNDVNQGGEQCDGTDDGACPGQCTTSCLCAACGDNSVNLPGEECDGTDAASCAGRCQVDCSCPLDHFLCYETKRRVFTPVPVTVVDQFGSASFTADRPERLCRPADKNGEAPGAQNDPDNLVAYRTRHQFVKVRDQVIVNQFGTTTVDVTKPDRLMVPSSLLLASPPPVVDHFQCYKVKRSRGSAKFAKILGVNVVDGYGSYTVNVIRPRYLCAPADKNGEDPGAETHADHLLCYKTQAPRLPGLTNQFATNQFGQQSLDLIRRLEFCVPSLKNPGSTTTTTIATTTTTAAPTTTTATTSTTTTTLYGSPSRAFTELVPTLLD